MSYSSRNIDEMSCINLKVRPEDVIILLALKKNMKMAIPGQIRGLFISVFYLRFSSKLNVYSTTPLLPSSVCSAISFVLEQLELRVVFCFFYLLPVVEVRRIMKSAKVPS